VRYNVHRDLNSTGGKRFLIKDENFTAVGSARYFLMHKADLAVNSIGSEKAKNTNARSTHAYARGDLVEFDNVTHPAVEDMVELTYRPHLDHSFIRTDTNEPVSYTSRLVGFEGKVYAQRKTLI
jgi:hypothetical protein